MKLNNFFFSFLLLCANSYVFASKADGDSGVARTENGTACKNARCIVKCCPFNQHVFVQITNKIDENGNVLKERRKICQNDTDKPTLFNLTQYEAFVRDIDMTMFNITTGKFLADENFRSSSVDVTKLTAFNVYLTAEAEVHLEMPNAYKRWTRIKNNDFCVDYKSATVKNITRTTPGIWVLMKSDDEIDPARPSNTFLTTAMLVSCLFLFLVLVVYGLLPELRNLCGMILMAYVASLLGAFLLLAVMRWQQHPDEVCYGLTYSIYFFFLASFCWMHVMSYDIWWTFRGYAKARPIHRRGESFKFAMYCLYALGLPLAMAIALGVLNNEQVYMKRWPWFVTPKIPSRGCFIEGGEKVLYLYVPMLILILCNWMFYLMTAFNIWRLSRGTAMLDTAAAGTPQAHRTHRQRFLVYLKLSIVMGLNWVLEVVSYVFPGLNVWFISDLYNILIGVFIFFIFVCKPKILRKLSKVCRGYKTARWYPGNSTRSASSTSDSNSSQETQTLQICANPKGPGYAMNNF